MRKRNKQIWLTILSVCILIGGCSEKTSTGSSSTDIDLAASLQQLQELNVSGYFNRLRFIPLETPDEGLIGKGPLWKLTGNHLMVTTRQECLLFDPETGKFLTSVGHVGNDPEGYSNATGAIPDEKNDRILFRGWGGPNAIVYDFSGNYQTKLPFIPLGEGMNTSPSAIVPVEKGLFAGSFTRMFGNEQYRLAFYNAAGDTVASYPNPLQQDAFEIHSISVFTDPSVEWKDPYVSLPELLDMQAFLYISWKEGEVGFASVMGENPFWQYDDRLYMKQSFNDTIFRIEGTQLIPDRIFALGENLLPVEERFGETDEKSIYISRVMEGDDLLLVRFATAPYNFAKRKDYNAVVNKKTGEVRANRIDRGLKDDIYDFIQLNPVAVSPSGTFMSVLQAEHICDWIDEHGAESLPRELSHLASLREDDNPVIVLMD